MRLGLLGGSFNPIHYGHLGIAREAREKLPLDQVLFMPTGDPPHKCDGALAPAKDRYEMVRLAIAGEPAWTLSDLEVRRSGKSYSIDTIRELHRQYGPSTKWDFLIGLDAFLEFPTWREPETLLRLCRFVVMSRPGQSYRSLAGLSLFPGNDPELLAKLDSGELARLEIAVPDSPGLVCLPLRPCSISASDIRRRIKQGLPLANLLPPPVESYILQHRLYQEDRDHTHV